MDGRTTFKHSVQQKGNGTTEPVWSDIGNGQYAYKFTTNDELFVAFHVTHDYKRGSKAYPHIHFIVDQTMTVGQQITWSFNYTIAKGHSQGESLTVAETSVTLVYTATGSELAGEHFVLEVSDDDAFDLIEPDAIVMARIKLDSENVSGDIFGIMCDLHYQIDRAATLTRHQTFTHSFTLLINRYIITSSLSDTSF